MFSTLLAVFLGGGLGSVARWQLGMRFNGLYPALPFGTLFANLIGAFIIGGALAYFVRHPSLEQHWKMLITSGKKNKKFYPQRYGPNPEKTFFRPVLMNIHQKK